MTPLAAWILSLMLLLEPRAPWRGTYERTADAIAKVAAEAPLFAGEVGADKTAALLVSVAWFEGRFDPRAVGDHKHSYCMFQVNDSNHAWLGVTRDQLLDDVEACARAALRMMHVSFAVCRGRPVEERLGHYAAGGNSCPDSEKGVHRVRKAMYLLARHPRPG